MTTQKGYPDRSPYSHLAQNLLIKNKKRYLWNFLRFQLYLISFRAAGMAVHILDDFIKKKYFIVNLDYSQVEVAESILIFRCGRSDIEDLAF